MLQDQATLQMGCYWNEYMANRVIMPDQATLQMGCYWNYVEKVEGIAKDQATLQMGCYWNDINRDVLRGMDQATLQMGCYWNIPNGGLRHLSDQATLKMGCYCNNRTINNGALTMKTVLIAAAIALATATPPTGATTTPAQIPQSAYSLMEPLTKEHAMLVHTTCNSVSHAAHAAVHSYHGLHPTKPDASYTQYQHATYQRVIEAMETGGKRYVDPTLHRLEIGLHASAISAALASECARDWSKLLLMTYR